MKLSSNLTISNPVIAASGTFGYGIEGANIIDIQRLGAIICKGTTVMSRPGNPQPRLVETASGLLNSIGLENIGVESLIKEKAPIWAGWKVPVIVNICGDTVDDYVKLASVLDGVAGVSGLEINISCPNVSKGCIEFGYHPDTAAEITAAVKAATKLPVIVKLTPNSTDIVAVAQAVAAAGADAISLINTIVGMAIDPVKQKPILSNITGGLSGPAIKPIALYMVYKVAQSVKVPVIGCGGIASASDALEFIMAGACAVQIGTASMVSPEILIDVLEGIEYFMKEKNIQDLSEIVGAAIYN